MRKFVFERLYHRMYKDQLQAIIYCKGKGGSPEELVINDPGIIISVILWFVVILLQIYFKDLINFNFNIIQ